MRRVRVNAAVAILAAASCAAPQSPQSPAPAGREVASSRAAATSTSTSPDARPATVPGNATVAWSPNGKSIALGSMHGVFLFTSGLQPSTALAGATLGATGLSWSPDGTKLAAALSAQRVTVWNATTGAVLGHLVGHTAQMTAVAWSRDGALIATSSKDGTVRLWNATTFAQTASLPYSGSGHVSALAWSPTGDRLAGGDTASVHVWTKASGALQSKIETQAPAHLSLAWAADGRRLVMPGPRVLDVASGQELGSFTGCSAGADPVLALRKDGLAIAVAGGGESGVSACVLQVNAQLQQTGGRGLETHDGLEAISAADWSPDGLRVVTSTWRGWLHVFEAATGTLQAVAVRPQVPALELEQLVVHCVPDDALEMPLVALLSQRDYAGFTGRVQSAPSSKMSASCKRHLTLTGQFLQAHPPATPASSRHPLSIEGRCSTEPDRFRSWRVKNPNPYDAEVFWTRSSGGPASKPFTVPAARGGAWGEWTFATPAVSGDNSIRIVSGRLAVVSPPSSAETCPTVDTALIIDSSGSMGGNDPGKKRLAAAKAYLAAAFEGDQVAVVDFDSDAVLYQPLTPLPENAPLAAAAIDRIDASGGTNIGAGIRVGCDALIASTSGNPRKAGILLTDGDGAFAGEDSCFKTRGWPIYAFGFGSANDSLLREIASNTGGEAARLPTSNLVCEFQRVRAKLAGSAPGPCEVRHVNPGQTVSFAVTVPSRQSLAAFSTSWPGSDVVLSLVTPSGRTIDRSTAAPDVVHDKGAAYEAYTVKNPEAGQWQVRLLGAQLPPGGEDVTFGLSTIATTVPADTTPPVISAVVNGISGKGGWYISEVAVSWNVSDLESSITASSGCERTVLANDTAGVTLTCTATNGVGLSSAKSVTLKVDQTGPEIAISEPRSGGTYAHAASLALAWKVTDPTSGVASEAGTLDGAAVTNGKAIDLLFLKLGEHTVTVSAEDGAGNRASRSRLFSIFADIDSLTAATDRLCSMGWINHPGTCNSLGAKLRAAKGSIGRGQRDAARGQLQAFLNELNAQRGKKLDQRSYDLLAADAQYCLKAL